jgi:hypothetical protein
MAFLEIFDEGVPQAIRDRVKILREEVDAIYDAAMQNFVTELPNRIAYDMSGNSSTSWNGDLMSPEERAQAISFVIRFDNLRDDIKVRMGPVGGKWHITNLWELRHMLNDVRPMIQNQKDSTFYTHVNATIQKRLRRTDKAEGMILRVLDESGNDVSGVYAAYLGENTKAIAAILNRLEYDYLYNGILQHADVKHSKRFLRDYTSGELNYILWKHVIVLGQIQYWLTPYYRVLRVLNNPALGSLMVAP